MCPQLALQIVCRNCSRNKYPLKYLKDRMAKVCDGCYGELKKRGGDVPGLMRGNLGTTALLGGLSPACGWCLKPLSWGGAEQKQPWRRKRGFKLTPRAPFPKMLTPWEVDWHSQKKGLWAAKLGKHSVCASL